ncbi:MAG: hypothetical protein KatS3mg016_0070 [Fimbriimonadales bacterium]|nr:MAG: hypothetical protein KatS3mg016_0070 [Fimbriimonadales bacterium]
MKRCWLIGCCVLLMGFGMAQEGDAPFLDGAMRPPAEESVRAKPPKLVAPQAKPTQITLPPTQIPYRGNGSDGDSTAQPRLVVGYSIDAPPNLIARAQWQRVQGGGQSVAGWVAHVQLRSQNAVGLRLQLQGRSHPDIQINIYDPNGETVLPARAYPDEEEKWWAPTLWYSDTIGIEVFVPDGVDAQRVPEIVAVGCMYTGIEPDFTPAELGCHLDVTCYPAYNDIKRGVARILYPEGSGWFLCTGQLLNRTNTDFSPIFMTAQHCISMQASAHGMEAYWFYQTATCNGTPPSLNSVPRTIGALLLKQHADSDWTLLGLYEPPAGNYYFGWDTNSWASGSSGSAVHHPGGTFKRITFFTTDGTWGGCGRSLWSSQVSLGNGTIEGGSSGSAGLDSAFRVRGSCSCAETAGNDANGNPIWKCPTSGDPVWVGWGRMDLAFPTIRWYIFEMANPTFVNRAVAGDPNNAGDSERGASANPFNTVYEGTFCVPTGGTVRIVPGNYNERFRVWRAMRLERSGTSGVVVIGRP